jgi:small redox-active disulfide protein 2
MTFFSYSVSILERGGNIMIKIQILGTGCPTCQKLTELTKQAADELGLEYEIEKITDITKIIEMGVIKTPGIAVDGVVKISGKLPSIEEIKELL